MIKEVFTGYVTDNKLNYLSNLKEIENHGFVFTIDRKKLFSF
jgi:hypothetical protein